MENSLALIALLVTNLAGALLFTSNLGKLFALDQFFSTLTRHPLTPKRYIPVVVYLALSAELLLGLTLLFRVFFPLNVAVGSLAFLLFAIETARQIHHQPGEPCGCYGILLDVRASKSHLVTNLLISILLALGYRLLLYPVQSPGQLPDRWAAAFCALNVVLLGFSILGTPP